MAQAIAPSKLRAAREQTQAARIVMRFRWTDEAGGHEVDLAFANLGARESRLVRMATGAPLDFFTAPILEGRSGIGIDSLAVLWWLARMAAGENIDFGDVEASCTYADQPELTVDDGTGDAVDPTPPPSDSEPSLPG